MKIMRVSLLAALLATTSLSAFADTSSMNGSVIGMGILENDYIKAGVNGTSGTFGSGGNTSPGLLFDSTGTGTFNTSYDYLTPGSPFDGWSIKIDGINTSNNNSGGVASWTDSDGLSDGAGTLTWQGTNSDYASWEVEHIYSLGASSEYVDVTTNITAGTSASDSTVYFGRFIDPDARAADGDSSATDNVLGYSGIPDSNVAFSEATVSRYALGLYSTDSNVDAGISSGWTTEADGYTDSPYTDSDSNSVKYGTGDHTIGLSWTFTGVNSGDILSASYAYIFGPSAFGAAESAIDGGAGGGTPGETPSDWGDVSDEGSATDAASGSSDPVVTYSDPVVDTDLPVLTASITAHTASDDGSVQTIAREKTTTTTTPMEIITYHDGVEYERNSTDSVVTTAITDPGSFTGRIDQITSAKDAVVVVLKGLEFDGVTAIGKKNKFDNGMTGNTKGFAIGGTRTNDEGLTIGGGFANVKTELKNDLDRGDATTRAGQVLVGKNNITAKVTHAMIDYGMERTIGDFSNSATASGTDTSLNIQYKGEGNFKPIIGYTIGQNKINEYTESGSIQSARSVAKNVDNYKFATVGAEASIGMFDIAALHHTDNTNEVRAGINKTTDSGSTFGINVARTKTKLGTTDSIVAGLSIKF